ncbi:hypothetical protein BDR07DRAFT_1382224 [Suillus spraguei]|nr:hypothetical protein BDR07DRAFT_1382224 [Suillus spraguei]
MGAIFGHISRAAPGQVIPGSLIPSMGHLAPRFRHPRMPDADADQPMGDETQQGTKTNNTTADVLVQASADTTAPSALYLWAHSVTSAWTPVLHLTSLNAWSAPPSYASNLSLAAAVASTWRLRKKVKMLWPMAIINLTLQSMNDNYLGLTVKLEAENHYQPLPRNTLQMRGGKQVSESRKVAPGIDFVLRNANDGFPPNTFIVLDTHSDEYSGMLQHTGGQHGGINTLEKYSPLTLERITAREDKTVLKTVNGKKPWCDLTAASRGGWRGVFMEVKALVASDRVDFVLAFGGSGTLPSMISGTVRSLLLEIGVFGETDVWSALCRVLSTSHDVLDYTTAVLVYAVKSGKDRVVECRQVSKDIPGLRAFGFEFKSCGTPGCQPMPADLRVYNRDSKVHLRCLRCKWRSTPVSTDEDNKHFKRIEKTLAPTLFWHHYPPSSDLQNFFVEQTNIHPNAKVAALSQTTKGGKGIDKKGKGKQRALAADIKEDWEIAADNVYQAIDREGHTNTFWCSIGVLYCQINQFHDALDAYSHAIRVKPYISEMLFHFGSLYKSYNNHILDATIAYARASEVTSNKFLYYELPLPWLGLGRPAHNYGKDGWEVSSWDNPAGSPIASFAIPSVNAECDFQPTDREFRFLPPEDVDVIEANTQHRTQTCRVPVMEGETMVGYIPLPLRYRAAWLHLSYTIVADTQTWSLWAAEEEAAKKKTSKEYAIFMRQNSGAGVAQDMLARLLVVDELVAWAYDASHGGKASVRVLDEWKIRWSRDWFNISYEQAFATGGKFLQADPINLGNTALFEENWALDREERALLFPPNDLDDWFDGEIEGFEELFKKTFKRQSIAALKKPDQFTMRQYDDKAVLPARWHEGQKPAPHFWSPFCNDLRGKPMEFLYCVLTQNPPYARFEQFLQDMNTLVNIVGKSQLERHQGACATALDGRDDLEGIYAANVFDTFEARLLLEGYVRRHDELGDNQPWNVRDDILWQGLLRVTVKKYGDGWDWVISQIICGKNVPDVLKSAGRWWAAREGSLEEDQSIPERRSYEPQQQESSDEDMQVDKDAEGSVSAGEDAEPKDAAHQTNEDAGPAAPDSGMRLGDNVDGSGLSAPDNGMQEDENIHGSGPGISIDGNFDRSEDREEVNTSEAQSSMLPAAGLPAPSLAPPLTAAHFPPQTLSNATEVRQAQQVAMDRFEEYLNHRDVNKYEDDLNACYSSEYAAIIKEHTDGLRASIEANQVPGPYAAVHNFVNNCKAIAKRKEAEFAQQGLL